MYHVPHLSLTIECLVAMLVRHLQDQGNLLLVDDLDFVLLNMQDDTLNFVLGLLVDELDCVVILCEASC